MTTESISTIILILLVFSKVPFYLGLLVFKLIRGWDYKYTPPEHRYRGFWGNELFATGIIIIIVLFYIWMLVYKFLK